MFGVSFAARVGRTLISAGRRDRSRTRLVAMVVVAASVLSGSWAGAAVVSLDEVDHWVGTGSNRAGLVIDWNDGKQAESLVWGYRWDGSATAEQMFLSVVAADPTLFAKIGTPGSFGTPVYGIGQNRNGGGFGIDDGTTFDAVGKAVLASAGAAGAASPVDDANPTDPADHYEEGWWQEGFWFHYQSATSPYAAGGSWSDGLGLSSQTLTNNAWTGLGYAKNFVGTAPGPAQNVPEPTGATVVVVAAAAGLLARWRTGRLSRR